MILRCSDDELDALSLWFKQHTRPSGRCMIEPLVESEELIWDHGKCTTRINLLEDMGMRFRIIKQSGHWEIEDTFDEESPVNGLCYVSRDSATKTRDWLNENIKEIPFKDRVKKVISELWDDDEIVVDECMGYTAVTEIKETCLTSSDILAKLDNCDVETHNICTGKSVFKISEEKE